MQRSRPRPRTGSGRAGTCPRHPRACRRQSPEHPVGRLQPRPRLQAGDRDAPTHGGTGAPSRVGESWGASQQSLRQQKTCLWGVFRVKGWALLVIPEVPLWCFRRAVTPACAPGTRGPTPGQHCAQLSTPTPNRHPAWAQRHWVGAGSGICCPLAGGQQGGPILSLGASPVPSSLPPSGHAAGSFGDGKKAPGSAPGRLSRGPVSPTAPRGSPRLQHAPSWAPGWEPPSLCPPTPPLACTPSLPRFLSISGGPDLLSPCPAAGSVRGREAQPAQRGAGLRRHRRPGTRCP